MLFDRQWLLTWLSPKAFDAHMTIPRKGQALSTNINAPKNQLLLNVLKSVWLAPAHKHVDGRETGKCEEGLAAMFWRTFKSGYTA